MAAEVTYDGIALRLDEALDGLADVAHGDAGPHHLDAFPHCRIGYVDQPLRLHADLADAIHAAGITVPAIENDGYVDIAISPSCNSCRRGSRDRPWLTEVQIDFGKPRWFKGAAMAPWSRMNSWHSRSSSSVRTPVCTYGVI